VCSILGKETENASKRKAGRFVAPYEPDRRRTCLATILVCEAPQMKERDMTNTRHQSRRHGPSGEPELAKHYREIGISAVAAAARYKSAAAESHRSSHDPKSETVSMQNTKPASSKRGTTVSASEPPSPPSRAAEPAERRADPSATEDERQSRK
jgi:hypothetical protein